MDTTLNLGLRKPDRTDKFDIADFNVNADILDNALQSRVNVLTRADYESISDKSNDTLYCVKDNNGKIKLYIGDDEIKTGSSAATAAVALVATKIPGESISDATFKSGYSEYERDENGNIIEKPSVSV